MSTVPDPVLDAPTDDEWGVYDTTCITCGKNIAIVATTHSVEYGYAEMMPDDAQCTECRERGKQNVRR